MSNLFLILPPYFVQPFTRSFTIIDYNCDYSSSSIKRSKQRSGAKTRQPMACGQIFSQEMGIRDPWAQANKGPHHGSTKRRNIIGHGIIESFIFEDDYACTFS